MHTKQKTNAKKLPKELVIDARTTDDGITILVNRKPFSVTYPREIWKDYDPKRKEILKDNVAYSATMFLPQILDLPEIRYKTNRPLSEAFYFKNGMYDMPCTALSDGKSSLDYVKRFFNTRYFFDGNTIGIARKDRPKKHVPTAIVPFSFGKESMLSVALCKEAGIRPILVNFIEPSNAFEYAHKKKLMVQFEKETGLRVYTVTYGPGMLRYGKNWGFDTELGWGLQTTEYAVLTLPFADHFNADYIILGNEQSCNDTFFDREGVLTYKAGYDQHSEWTAQQGLLASLILGRDIRVASFMEPLYEIAITKILHNRYPTYGKHQMSCMASTEHAKNNRWCQRCVKCGYMFALCNAFDIDLERIGFTENLFDKDHAHLYDHFFNYDPQAPEYGSEEELGLAFLMAYRRGATGHSIDLFKKKKLKKIAGMEKDLVRTYLGVNPHQNIPEELDETIIDIYKQELDVFTKHISRRR